MTGHRTNAPLLNRHNRLDSIGVRGAKDLAAALSKLVNLTHLNINLE